MSVSVNPPKTPVTKGSNGVACATIPNVCKMPGPPAPFVPVPLPNIGKSGDSPKGYTKKVKVQGKAVAIKGATFKSMGDIASKGTGGGLISANTHGPTKFVGPGSMNVKFEGKNVHVLSDPMLNNCGGSGSPPNSATLVGVVQNGLLTALVGDELCPLCGETHKEKGSAQQSSRSDAAVQRLKDAIVAARAEASSAQSLAALDRAADQAKRALRGTQGEERTRRNQDVGVANSRRARATRQLRGMMGGAVCDCGASFVAMSSSQYEEVADIVSATDHTPVPYGSLLMKEPPRSASEDLDRFLEVIGSDKEEDFRILWQLLEDNVEPSRRGQTDQDFNPPGRCAAQLVFVLALSHGCLPTELTEKFYSSRSQDYSGKNKDGSPRFKLLLRDQKPDGSLSRPRRARAKDLRGDKAIPPCGTCQEILPALVCGKDSMEHSTYEDCQKCP